LAISLIAALSVVVFGFGFVAYLDPASLFGTHAGPGAFYKLMPHKAMALLFGAVFAYAVLALVFSMRSFWSDIAGNTPPAGFSAFLQAAKDAVRLRYLDGGNGGCMNDDDQPTDRRKHYHHVTFYGFLLCFASTSVATLYHYLLGREAPYPWWDLPVVLGTVGGIGLVVGSIGLLIAKFKRAHELLDKTRFGMDVAFLVMLLLAGSTGLALLVLRATPAMGITLAVHLGVVFGLFLTFPYGKFVHGLYRFLALAQYARENKVGHQVGL
jgi:citrate/tricarballylate utilization protein